MAEGVCHRGKANGARCCKGQGKTAALAAEEYNGGSYGRPCRQKLLGAGAHYKDIFKEIAEALLGYACIQNAVGC